MAISQTARVNVLIGTGHFLSHFYLLSLPPVFLAWQREFGVSYAELGLSLMLMSGVTAVLQTPVGFLVDRYGARIILVGGALVMSLSVGTMGFATAYWQILALSVLSGIGNSVFHPADYAILSGSVPKERMGSAFALHSFNGNLGFVAGPPTVALLMALMDWRAALALVGALGVPVVGALLWQSRFLRDQARAASEAEGARRPDGAVAGGALLLSRPMVLFFIFYLLGSMAGGGVQAWLVTVLQDVKGLDLASASTALTAYMGGATAGVLAGGWIADRGRYIAAATAGLTIASAVAILLAAALPLTGLLAIGLLFLSGTLLGASRTPRDILVKDACPPGQIGKVFGFVSAGLPLGNALVPVPFGYLIDRGHPELILVLVAALLLLSLLCMGTAKAKAADRASAPAPAE